MGVAESTSGPPSPIPKHWEVQLSSRSKDDICKELIEISSLSIENFMAAEPYLAELQVEAWNFERFFPYASAAVQVDSRLNKMVYVMVPKRATEEEFWRLYFCHVYRILFVRNESGEMEEDCAFDLTKGLLQSGDDTAVNTIIAWLEAEPSFHALAQKELERLLHQEKDRHLQILAGLRMAVSRGVLQVIPPIEPTIKIDVSSKDVDDVAQCILKNVGDAYKQGCAITLQGLGGTGKTSVIAKLKDALPCVFCWSEETLFRAVTLLAVQHCGAENARLNVESLSPDILQELLNSIRFARFNEKYDIQLSYGTCVALVSEIEDTLFQDPSVEQNLPIIEQLLRGEVIKFSINVVEVLLRNGVTVLIEGHPQILNYIPATFRVELSVSDGLVIGARRVAQKLLRPVLDKLNAANELQPEEILGLLKEQLIEMRPAPTLSKELLDVGGDEAISAIIDALERDISFIELSEGECRGGESLHIGMRRAAEQLMNRLHMSWPEDLSSDNVTAILQRELNKATAL